MSSLLSRSSSSSHRVESPALPASYEICVVLDLFIFNSGLRVEEGISCLRGKVRNLNVDIVKTNVQGITYLFINLYSCAFLGPCNY